MTLTELHRLQARLITILAETDIARQSAPIKRIRAHATEALRMVEVKLDEVRNT